jgi:hypothetical protein
MIDFLTGSKGAECPVRMHLSATYSKEAVISIKDEFRFDLDVLRVQIEHSLT